MTRPVKPVRWTPARIREAMLLPKPVEALGRYRRRHGHHLAVEVPAALRLLYSIISGADRLDVTDAEGSHFLLIRMDRYHFDRLCAFGASLEDYENDDDREEADKSDDEPSLGSGNVFDQTNWVSGDTRDVDREDDMSDYEDDGEEPNVTSPTSMQRACTLQAERMTVREWREDMLPVLEAAD